MYGGYIRTTFPVTKGQTTSRETDQSCIQDWLRWLLLVLYRWNRQSSRNEKKGTYKRNVEQCKSGSYIAKHAWTQDHKINFDTCKILDKPTYRHRATLKSWHTAITMNSNNNAQHLPEQYGYLLIGDKSQFEIHIFKNTSYILTDT